ncbi:MAG: cation diffusion facilitator family transporter [archaeon]|nr:cation diffusion facilitator family transporter [archaeon]
MMKNEELTAAQRNYNFQKIIAAVGAILMITKFFAYFLTSSVSILTDAMESIVNVIAGIVGVYALYLTMIPADEDHPYGHGKIELISSSVEGSLICLAGALILLETAVRFIEGDFRLRDLDIGLIIVIIAAVVNFAMGYTAIRMGRASNSIALAASGKHLCTDTYSSVGIILGLGVVMGLEFIGINAYWIDPVMAGLFGAFIIYTGINVLRESMAGIMDKADMEIISEVTDCFNRIRTSDVIDVHHLRVNKYGAAIHVDAHMTVPDSMTVGESDKIIQAFRSEVFKNFDGDVDMTVMVEPCNKDPCKNCPSPDCGDRKSDYVEPKIIVIDSAIKGDPDYRNMQENE